jgi:lipoate synthase
MKLLKTIERMVKESEEAYNRAVESFADEKTVTKLEKQYQESLRLMEMYERMNNVKKKR